MTADQERDEIIEELRTGLREQQSMLAAQTERITLLEGERRSPRTARPTADQAPERRPRRLTRGGMLKAAAMGAIGLAGAEAASTLGAESALADTSSATNFRADGPDGVYGFYTQFNSNFLTGAYFSGTSGVLATGTTGNGLDVRSESGHAVSALSNSLAANNASVILAQVPSSAPLGNYVSAVRGQVDSTGSYGIAVYGSHAGSGWGVYGTSSGAGYGVYGLNGTGTGVKGESAGGTGVQGQTDTGTAVRGTALNTTGTSTGTGVLGESNSGTGIRGQTDPGKAVWGVAHNPTGTSAGTGVQGDSGAGVSASSQTGHAVYGTVGSLATDESSVILAQVSPSTSLGYNVSALRGQVDSTSGLGIGVYGSHAGDGYGVHGTSAGSGYGLNGLSATGIGTYGESGAKGDGVFGLSAGGAGVHGYAGSFNNADVGGYGGKFEIYGRGQAQLLLTPFGSGGRPTNGTHTTGEIFMDPNGNLFVCTAAGSPGTWKQVAYTGGGPTDARLRHFTIARHADRVDFHWRMADGKGVAGFELYAAGHRLNRETIRPHRAKTYDASATWKGNGPFALHVLLRDGNVISVQPE